MNNEVEIKVTAKDESKRGLDSATRGIKGVGDAAKGTSTTIKGLGDQADRTEERLSRIGSGGADLGRYRQDLDGVGDGFNDVEDRAMGAGNIINGVNDMMARDDPATFAMGLSDLAAGIRYTVVPSLQDGARGLKGIIDQHGGVVDALKSVGLAAGAVGLAVAAGTIAWNSYQRTQDEVKDRSGELADAFEAEAKGAQNAVRDASVLKLAHGDVGRSLKDLDADFRLLAEGMRENPRAAEELDNALGLITSGGRSAAEVLDRAGIATNAYTAELVRMIDSDNLSAGQKKDLIEALDAESDRLQETAADQDLLTDATEGTTEAHQREADAIRGVSDALAAQVDPAFAVIDANNRMADASAAIAEAQTAVNEAAAEFGEGSPEHVQALQDLQRAQIDQAQAGWSQQQSLRDLAGAMAESGISIDTIIGRLQAMVGQNGVTQASVDAVAWSLRNVPGQVHSVLTADASQAHVVIEGVAGALRNVRLLASGVVITAAAQAAEHQSKRPKRHGGNVGAARTGGVRGAMTLVGEGGPELVRLPYGSSVIPAGTTREMMRGAAGGDGETIVIDMRGAVIASERQFQRMVVDALAEAGRKGTKIAVRGRALS